MVGFWWDNLENKWDGSPPSRFDFPNTGHPSPPVLGGISPKVDLKEKIQELVRFYFLFKAKVYVDKRDDFYWELFRGPNCLFVVTND